MNWIPLDIRQFTAWKPRELNGVMVEVCISPFDVPDAVAAYPDKENGQFVIQFKYRTDEPLAEELIHTPHATVQVGKNSKRIYKIAVDVKSLTPDQMVGLNLKVQSQFEQSIDDLATKDVTNRL